MKKIDCITFLNGIDVLKLRLAELVDHIDLFVVVESTHDFMGHPKPLYLKDSLPTGYPIKYVVTEPRWTGDLTNKLELAWNNTNGMVEDGFREGCAGADASDIGYFSDFDEIMRPSKLLAGDLSRPVCFEMELFVYWLNCKANRKGRQTTRCPIGQIESFWSALMFRYAPEAIHNLIPEAGWHLTSFGGLETVIEKFKGYNDQQWVAQLKPEEVWSYMIQGRDMSDLGSPLSQCAIGPLSGDLPGVVLKSPKDYVHLIHPDWREGFSS